VRFTAGGRVPESFGRRTFAPAGREIRARLERSRLPTSRVERRAQAALNGSRSTAPMSRTKLSRPPGVPSSVRWPLPLPSRPRWAWLLGTRVRRWRFRRLLRFAQPHWPPTPATVADLGAGTGIARVELWNLGLRRTGDRLVLLDAQREMLPNRGNADPRTIGVDLVLGDAALVPLRTSSVSVVLSIGLLCCVSERSVASVVAETDRILAPGGLLVLGVPAWRGHRDERAFAALGLVRLAGGRAGRAIFRKRD
jgi:SAM-dependent methyltransferase